MSDVGLLFDDGVFELAEYERVEQLYLKALEALLDDAGSPDLIVSDVQLSPLATSAAKALRDGARVGANEALAICRLALREEVSCRLDAREFHTCVGFDYYLYVECEHLKPFTVKMIESFGLFVEHGVPSPYSLE